MPKQGYYVKGAFETTYYTTGKTKGGGHMWARPSQFQGWTTLNWNAVPGTKTIEKEKLQYYEQLPPQAAFLGILPKPEYKPKKKSKKLNVATDLATNTLVNNLQNDMVNAISEEDYEEGTEAAIATKQGFKPVVISHVKVLNEDNAEDEFDKMMLQINEYFRPELIIARNAGHQPVFRVHYKEDSWTMNNSAPTWKYKIEFHQNMCIFHRRAGKSSFKFQIDYLNQWDAGEIVKAMINPVASEDKIGLMGHMIKPFEVPLEILKAQADQSEADEDNSVPIGRRKLLI